MEIFFPGHSGNSRAPKLAPSCPLGYSIAAQNLPQAPNIVFTDLAIPTNIFLFNSNDLCNANNKEK